MLCIECIDDVDRLRQFAPEWSQFLKSAPPATPFQTPEWLLTWWSHFGSGKLHVLVFKLNERVAGVVPCFLHDWNNQLTLIGTGMSDYLDPVFDPHCRSATIEALARHLESNAQWDVCDWQDLSGDSPLRVLGMTVEDTPCSVAPLADSFEIFLAARPRRLQRYLRRYREKAQALAPVHFEVTSHADPTRICALLDLHRARWLRSGQPGTIDANNAGEFVRSAANTMSAAGALTIFTLYFRERIVAIIFALRNETTIFSYLTAFDPEHQSLSFGHELLARAFEYAHANGYHYWNFLRGDEPYKADWGGHLIPKCRLKLERSTGDRTEVDAADPVVAGHL